MPELIQCPKCGRKLKVPETLQGKSVKCPGCQGVFTAKFGADEDEEEIPRARRRAPEPEDEDDEEEAAARPRRRPVAEDDDADEEDEQDEERPRRKRLKRRRRSERPWGIVIAPAICMLIAAIIGLGFDVFGIITALGPKPQPIQQVPGANPAGIDFLAKAQERGHGPGAAALQGVFALDCLVIILGCVMMLTGKAHGVAVTASVLSMLNLGNCCCILGLPFGIWSLIILLRADVKGAFQ